MNNTNATQTDRTAVNVALLSIRIIVGIIFVAHGSQKLLGAFGGDGLSATVAHMGTLGYFVTAGEFFGGLGLIVGLLPRFSASALIVTMIGAIVTVHGKNGFFAQAGGFEYPLALIGLLLPIVIAGPGAYAISEQISFGRLLKTRTQH